MAVVIPSTLLTDPVLTYLGSLSTTKGVVVLDQNLSDADVTSSFLSPDVQTPQGDGTPSTTFTIGQSHVWNTYGNGIAYQSYNFPIVLATGNI